MTTSDTPETDDLAITCYIDSVIEGVFGFRAVPIDDCRKLERERDEAITRRMETIMQCELYEQERDEARDQVQLLRVENNHNWQAIEMAEQAFRERDEACKLAGRAIDDLAWFNETNAQILRAELDQLKEGAK